MTIKVVRGNPTPEELAAALAVLTVARTAGSPEPPTASPTGAWNSRRRLLRTPYGYGPTGWRACALPL
ncbi:acyl-CoA carboxylase subunit epsilon [Streptomyces mexicanus]|jgi:hypothetical protein|uniref:acyl-CoA carboxylase subunit epsilon n=1 Tax=Streptomyces mexicanus TaxID=178566 RepID=UPI00040F4A84